jgi:DNA polymerase-3 subunit epsilon
MKVDRRLIQAIVVIGVASVVWLALTIGLITSTLEPAQRALVSEQLAPRLALIGLTWVFGLVAIGATLRWLFRRYATAPARLVEQTQVLLAAPKATPMNHQGTKETKALADVIFQLASQRDSLREDVAAQIAQASAGRAAGEEPAGCTDVGADAKCGGVQPGRAHHPLQQPGPAAVQDLVASRLVWPAARSWWASAARSTRCLSGSWWRMRWRAFSQRVSRGAGSPSAQFVTTTPVGATAEGANGASAQRGRR